MSIALRALFAMEASKWGRKHPKEENKLAGELLYWASSVSASGAAGDAGELVVSQIRDIARRNEVSPEQVVEDIFQAETADDVMATFQLA